MKRWHAIVGLGILAAAATAAYQYRAELGLETLIDPAAAPATTHLSWHKADHTQDGFAVDLPGAEQQTQIEAQNGTGGTEPVNMIYADPDTNINFSISWADDPPVARANQMDPIRTLDAARDEALTHTKATLAGENKLAVQGFPARDLRASNAQGGVFSARLVLAGGRLYMLMASFPSATARHDKDVAHFFDSFTLINSSR